MLTHYFILKNKQCLFFYVKLHLIVQNKNLMFYTYLISLIKTFTKNYIYIFITLFILIKVIFFSEELGLGVEKDFILYQLIGIFRSSIFFTFIFITLQLFVILIMVKIFFNQQQNELSNQNMLKNLLIYTFF